MPTTRDLERGIRGYIATGAGLPSRSVIPGNTNVPRPDEAYATVLLIDDQRQGYPITQQRPLSPSGSIVGTDSISYRKALYSVQFYRKGAVDFARTFSIWAESENGLTAAEVGEFRLGLSLPLPAPGCHCG